MVTAFQLLVRTDKLSVLEALKVTAIGLLVVFAILAILILFIELLHIVLKEKTPDTEVKTVKENTQRISAGVMAQAPDATDAPNDPEFLAAVSTAISVYTGKPNGSFKIKSIKNK